LFTLRSEEGRVVRRGEVQSLEGRQVSPRANFHHAVPDERLVIGPAAEPAHRGFQGFLFEPGNFECLDEEVALDRIVRIRRRGPGGLAEGFSACRVDGKPVLDLAGAFASSALESAQRVALSEGK